MQLVLDCFVCFIVTRYEVVIMMVILSSLPARFIAKVSIVVSVISYTVPITEPLHKPLLHTLKSMNLRNVVRGPYNAAIIQNRANKTNVKSADDVIIKLFITDKRALQSFNMQMSHVALGCSIVVVLVTVVCLPSAAADDVIIQKRVYPAEMERMLDPKRKRPFCNAFTGCGKKRADESMGTLVELNSEPAVEELSRQIMSEAKLWEAIQEARLELLRRRQQQQLQPNQFSDRPTPFTGYRKKRSVGPVPETKKQVGKSIPWAR